MTGELRLDHIEHADALAYLKTLPDESVNLCVTSPPYFGLRDYGADGQIGLEDTPAAYIARLVAVFAEVRRVLRDDGNCYVNLGDSYTGSGRGPTGENGIGSQETRQGFHSPEPSAMEGLPAKSLMLIPHRFAIAMQDAGWLLREDIVWEKRNPMPESVRDRCTRSHEYIFHFTKGPRYWYDAQAVAEATSESTIQRWGSTIVEKRNPSPQGLKAGSVKGESTFGVNETRNRRSVWTINPARFTDAHFATFPEAIPEIIIQAACPEWCCEKCGAPYEAQVIKPDMSQRPTRSASSKTAGGETHISNGWEGYPKSAGQAYQDWRNANPNIVTGYAPSCTCNAGKRAGVVLDPFMGAGTTALVAKRLNRRYLGCDLNASYVAMARERINSIPYTLFSLMEATSG